MTVKKTYTLSRRYYKFSRPEGHATFVILCRHYEMRENNHAHSTATSFNSNKLTVTAKHFWGRNICETKANRMNSAWNKNQILAYRQIASAKSLSARGASHQPAFMGHKCFSCRPSRWAGPGFLYPIMIGLMVVMLTFMTT